MVYIYEKDMASGKSKVYMEVPTENQAKAQVADLNEMSIYYEKFYFVSKKLQENT